MRAIGWGDGVMNVERVNMVSGMRARYMETRKTIESMVRYHIAEGDESA